MARQQKSKMRIVRALEKMMQDTPIDKVQVTRLCEEADVGRATFYDNFDNVFNVATWYWDCIVDETVGQIGKGLSFYQAHEQLFIRLRDEGAFFSHAFRDHFRSINQHGYNTIGDMYFDLVEKHLGRSVNDEERMAIAFYNTGASDYCAEWVSTGMHEDPILLARTFANAAPPVMDFLQ